ncbi:transposase family protein [Micromonospora sp. NPDC092111]|uniref:transposase family protein n=1 Tax=Micromonospora sp. NPDC092111 TaxID=3364289 RepID=UPI00380E2D58
MPGSPECTVTSARTSKRSCARTGLPIWTSAALPGHLHDTSCARELGITAALNWSAAELDLPALADSGHESAGHGIKTPIKQPADGSRLAPDNRAYNRLLRGLRWQGERGFAILTGRWKTLRHTTIAHAASVTSSPPRYTSPTSSTNTYRKVAEITSLDPLPRRLQRNGINKRGQLRHRDAENCSKDTAEGRHHS